MKRLLCLALAALLLASFPDARAATAPYESYIYNADGRAVPSPAIAVPEQAVTGNDLGIGPFVEPQDLYVDGDGRLWLADTGNHRLVVLDDACRLIRVLDTFRKGDETLTLDKPEGIFVDNNNRLYIADTGHARVLVTDMEGQVLHILERPDTSLLPDTYVFQPKKVVSDSSGAIFVLAQGVYQGLLSYNSEGTFLGFYGGNRVQMTLEIALDRLWRKFLTADQIAATKRYVPSEYVNLDIDDGDFLFTCDATAANQIKQLNSLGENILEGTAADPVFGDPDAEIVQNAAVRTVFVDVNVDETGIISCLDATRGKVFRYDTECRLLGVFGSMGSQVGAFELPTALESRGDELLVLDGAKNSLTVFRRTAYGACIEEAVSLYNDGRYEEAIGPWREVLGRNGNAQIAHEGMGKAQLKLGQYREAMDSFRKAGDNRSYSEAFSLLRNQWLRAHFGLVAAGIALVVIGLLAAGRWRRRRGKGSGADE